MILFGKVLPKESQIGIRLAVLVILCTNRLNLEGGISYNFANGSSQVIRCIYFTKHGWPVQKIIINRKLLPKANCHSIGSAGSTRFVRAIWLPTSLMATHAKMPLSGVVLVIATSCPSAIQHRVLLSIGHISQSSPVWVISVEVDMFRFMYFVVWKFHIKVLVISEHYIFVE